MFDLQRNVDIFDRDNIDGNQASYIAAYINIIQSYLTFNVLLCCNLVSGLVFDCINAFVIYPSFLYTEYFIGWVSVVQQSLCPFD